MLVRSRFPEDGNHTGGDFSPSVSRVTNRDSSRGPLVIDTMSHGRADRVEPPGTVINSARARDEPFFRGGDEPEAKSQLTPSSLRQGAPVNRRYGHVEDALGLYLSSRRAPPSIDRMLQ